MELFTPDWTSTGSTQRPSINSRRTLDNLDTFDNLDLTNWITELVVRRIIYLNVKESLNRTLNPVPASNPVKYDGIKKLSHVWSKSILGNSTLMYQVTTLQRIKRDPNMADETEYIKLKVFFSSSK